MFVVSSLSAPAQAAQRRRLVHFCIAVARALRFAGALGLCLFFSSRAAADPLRILPLARVFAPERPTLTLFADEDLKDLTLALEPIKSADGQPSTESAPQNFSAKKLAAGQKLVVPLGRGKLGTTHWRGMIQCQAGGKLWKREVVDLTTQISRKLEIRYDPNYFSSHLSLDKHYVEVQLSVPARRGEVHVYGDDGSEIGSGRVTFAEEPPSTWLRLPWESAAQATAGTVLRLNLSLYDHDGNFATIDLYPWSMTVPHEDVNFLSGSAEISDGERSKLDESLRKIATALERVESALQRFSKSGVIANPPAPRLFVAGHTDTVGSDGDNLSLSQNRARAIAGYFQKQGLRVPIYFVGVGERQPRVKTADNTDELRNRRADYTLALEEPPLLAGLSWHKL